MTYRWPMESWADTGSASYQQSFQIVGTPWSATASGDMVCIVNGIDNPLRTPPRPKIYSKKFASIFLNFFIANSNVWVKTLQIIRVLKFFRTIQIFEPFDTDVWNKFRFFSVILPFLNIFSTTHALFFYCNRERWGDPENKSWAKNQRNFFLKKSQNEYPG